MDKKVITHKEFLEKYKSGLLKLFVVKSKAGDFVLSEFADKHNKPAHIFWTWTGIILFFPLPIVLLFIKWPFAIISVIIGSLILSGARKSASQFVIENMLEDERFWLYVLIHDGAVIRDAEFNVYSPDVSEEFINKYK